jgi:diguanylate cyclase (GGDEF)-like protein
LLQRIVMPRRAFSWAVAVIMLCVVFAVVALTIYRAQLSDRRNLSERFRLRAEIAEAFLRTYLQEILAREGSMASRQLADPQLSEATFGAVVRRGGFEAALLLDASGQVIHVYPSSPELRGSTATGHYAHLRVAMAEGTAVSNVVASAAQSVPVVAFATRFDTPTGPRVFSGAFDVRTTPLNAYMSNLLEQEGANADLIDARGVLIASSRALTASITLLDDVDPKLSQALRAGQSAEYEGEHGRKLLYERKVTGSPWRLIISADQATLFASLEGPRVWLPWALFGAFCAASIVAAYLLVRLRAVSQMHARLARVDRLTGLPNRLHLEEHMSRMVSAAGRHGRPFSVFMADVDHFKRVNDTYGHNTGDEVLRALAERMAKALRAEDMLGRWGGEEFLALLPNTTVEGAYAVANRVRTMASGEPIVTSTGEQLRVTISIGCATVQDARDNSYVERADEALYKAKEEGRNRVVSSAPPSAAAAHSG